MEFDVVVEAPDLRPVRGDPIDAIGRIETSDDCLRIEKALRWCAYSVRGAGATGLGGIIPDWQDRNALPNTPVGDTSTSTQARQRHQAARFRNSGHT